MSKGFQELPENYNPLDDSAVIKEVLVKEKNKKSEMNDFDLADFR